MPYITQPAPQKSGYTNFNATYALTYDQVNNLIAYLGTSSFIDDIKLLFNSPLDNIVSLRVYPFDIKENSVRTDKNDETIKINVVDTGVNGYDLNNTPATPINIGRFEIPPFYGNFLDYSPYTKIEIYLPYIGIVTLDNTVVVGKNISIDYVIDYFSGKCQAFISTYEEPYPDKTIVMSFDGAIGVDIQIGGGQMADIARNILKTAIGVASGGLYTTATILSDFGAFTKASNITYNLGDTALNALENGKVNISKGVATQPALSFYCPQYAYLIITRPNVVDNPDYKKYFGLPLGEDRQLKDLTGFTIVDSIHVDGLSTATSDEIAEVERLLKYGVIL